MCSSDLYNETILDMITPGQLNVLTIHAEVEGIICAGMFEDFLTRAQQRNIEFVCLRDLLPPTEEIPLGKIRLGNLAGRQGSMCLQETVQ